MLTLLEFASRPLGVLVVWPWTMLEYSEQWTVEPGKLCGQPSCLLCSALLWPWFLSHLRLPCALTAKRSRLPGTLLLGPSGQWLRGTARTGGNDIVSTPPRTWRYRERSALYQSCAGSCGGCHVGAMTQWQEDLYNKARRPMTLLTVLSPNVVRHHKSKDCPPRVACQSSR